MEKKVKIEVKNNPKGNVSTTLNENDIKFYQSRPDEYKITVIGESKEATEEVIEKVKKERKPKTE